MTRRTFHGFTLGFAAAALGHAASPEQEARKAAEAWLALIDKGKYGESWEAAAVIFKQQIPQARWEGMAKEVRGRLGALESRAFQGARLQHELPGAPYGDYVVIQFSSSFENQKNAVETVTPMKDPDGAWRVSGYFIR